MPRTELAVRVEGLRDLRRDLRAVEKDLGKELTEALKEGAQPVVSEAQDLAPARPRSGRLRRSIKAYAVKGGVGVGSRLPYANVIHWGGTTGRGHVPGRGGSGSVKVTGTEFVRRAAESKDDEVLNDIADAVDRLLTRHGFK